MAVERLKEYSESPTEAPPIIESNRPSDDWPSQGHVKFDHYSTRYREGLDLVLKDITVDITGGTKVDIDPDLLIFHNHNRDFLLSLRLV